ncbi:MAG TPA: glycoside hydrolase family 13 protein [Daejeonella sp.]|nr:glycoside hydrolase family 13 protein [Daejeonella sp.]
MRHKICLLILLSTFFISAGSFAAIAPLERIEPSFWWTGMNNPALQLIVHGENISQREVQLSYPGVTLKQVHKVENTNYLFIDLEISASAKPGKFTISFKRKGSKPLSYSYELKAREQHIKAQGVTNKDFVYLIMPDRFANGDKSNDVIKGMKETSLNRDSMYLRHGGDLQGIIDNLDYLQELGVTTLWLNPVLENDQPKTSYHGYANTENYKIDRRYGSNELYKQLVAELHKRGMKMMKDLVHNHVGTEHWTIKDMPSKDWVHQWPAFTKTSYKDQVLFDPYASEADKKIMTDGWFDGHMPDMNQKNPFVRNYFTQSHIWWIEYSGLDGFRLDTYAYNDAGYMAEWAKAITAEYPQMTYFGETWVHGLPNQAYFTEGNTINQNFDTGLQSVTDFQGLWGITEALNGKFGWNEGVNRLYTTIASDFLYKDPTKLVVFLSNHDLPRFYSLVKDDIRKYKMGIAWLLTTRGIPQFYYGDEILMKGLTNPDGLVRLDFKGGWAGDKDNKFTAAGRSESENDAFNYVKKLATYRKNSPVLQTGKLMQYVPENGVYVYFRYDTDKTVMVVMNTNETEINVSTARFKERIDSTSAINVLTDESVNLAENLKVPAQTTAVFELK